MSAPDDPKSHPPAVPPSEEESPTLEEALAGDAKTVQMASLPPELQRRLDPSAESPAAPPQAPPRYPDPSLSAQPLAGQGAPARPPGPPPGTPPPLPPQASQPPPQPPSARQAASSPSSPPGPPPQAPPARPGAMPPAGPGAPYGQMPPSYQPAPVSGTGAGATLKATAKEFVEVYLRRAFRVTLRPEDVLDKERAALQRADTPVTDPNVQAFLAWRKSLLVVVGVFLVPVTIMSAVETFTSLDPNFETLNSIAILLWLVTAGFTVAVWVLLRSWTAWAKQRRWLFRAWLVFFLAPFLAWLIPFRSVLGGGARQALLAGVLFSVIAILTLAPKALSLMPGLIRASVVAKVLFPGAAAPGWLMALAAPIYALIVYVILLTPYQITGNGLFVPAMIGLIGAPLWLARSGYDLARPMSQEDAVARIRKARAGYLGLNAFGLLFLLIALLDLVSELDIGVLSAINLILALIVNVLLLGLVATDLLLVSLERARGIAGDPSAEGLRREYDQRLHSFLTGAPGLSAPPQQPPPKQ